MKNWIRKESFSFSTKTWPVGMIMTLAITAQLISHFGESPMKPTKQLIGIDSNPITSSVGSTGQAERWQSTICDSLVTAGTKSATC